MRLEDAAKISSYCEYKENIMRIMPSGNGYELVCIGLKDGDRIYCNFVYSMPMVYSNETEVRPISMSVKYLDVPEDDSDRWYDDEWDCGNCGHYTMHKCKDSQHERDSSGDYRECTVCGWYVCGMSGKYSPPTDSCY